MTIPLELYSITASLDLTQWWVKPKCKAEEENHRKQWNVFRWAVLCPLACTYTLITWTMFLCKSLHYEHYVARLSMSIQNLLFQTWRLFLLNSFHKFNDISVGVVPEIRYQKVNSNLHLLHYFTAVAWSQIRQVLYTIAVVLYPIVAYRLFWRWRKGNSVICPCNYRVVYLNWWYSDWCMLASWSLQPMQQIYLLKI